MITSNYISLDAPKAGVVALAGVRCYCLNERKSYEQTVKPSGSRWLAVGFGELTGQKLVGFLFGIEESRKVDISNTVFYDDNLESSADYTYTGENITKITVYRNASKTSVDRVIDLEYDVDGNVIKKIVTGSTNRTFEYLYDINGNITNKNEL